MAALNRSLSPQAVAVYKQLNKGLVLNAQEIAARLDILPNAVYRVTGNLIKAGVIEEVSGYPKRYKALPVQLAMSTYLQAAAQSFRHELLNDVLSPQINNGPTITLIKNRADALARSNADARAAKESINFIVSGFEVPDSTVLAFRKAGAIGVPIRAIVQHKPGTIKDRLEKWQEIGAEVKYLPDISMRLFIFDQSITYLLSYDATNKNSAFGVRFDYEPLALQMNLLFEQNWQKAKPL